MSTSPAIRAHLDAVKGQPVDTAKIAERAVQLAGELLKEANARRTPADKRQGEKMSRMMDDPQGKAFTVALADRAFRSSNPAVVTEQLRHLLKGYGIPKYLFPQEKFLMGLGAAASRIPGVSGIVASQVTRTLREESKSVILPGEDAALSGHVQKRRKDNIRLNLNKLGEAILGEEEAAHRFKLNLELLSSENAEYISVKISSVFSRCNAISFEWTVGEIQKRLREFYRVAMKNPVTLADGSKRAKFVNLDMEEYRDLEMTIAAFTRTLDEPEFMSLRAGIVLQAYLPDAYDALRYLTEWSKKRVARGGASIKVRIVKGANLAMETAEAAIKDWEVAPYVTKADVDANYKKCVRYALTKENTAAVNIGVASHNLFDVAFALLLRSAAGIEKEVEIEMLEGMANHQASAVRDAADGLLLYAPVVTADDFQSAIAYLVRRLDENTAECNFLHDLFGLEVGSPTWDKQRKMFLTAVKESDTVSTKPRRQQNRATETWSADTFAKAKFHNSPDTDWVLRNNREWLEAKIAALKSAAPAAIGLTIGGEEITPNLDGKGDDPARPGVTAYTYAIADEEVVETCLESAVEAQAEWAAKPVAERRAILMSVAAELEKSRGELIATMILDGGKTAYEADCEISEAIDFASYYARAFDDKNLYAGAKGTPRGVITVAPPWNFPVAIPAGGVLAALMAGCSVIFKPAPESVLCGRRMMEALWRGGVPKAAAQFIVAPDNHIGKRLIVDARVAGVVLTGATATADMFLDWKPSLALFAETGGKNALIITANADRDQAIKDLVKSAFGHAGQKCSAASLAILEAEIYDDPTFRKQLKDAASSLIVGSAWDLQTEMPPVVREPEGALKRGLTTLDAGESWLLEPRMLDNNPCLWTPGIKLGVTNDSWFRKTENFGPVLGLVRAENLMDAIRIQNDSTYGLTGGIHTLDEREIAIWKDRVEVGNAYINRPITGAIVNRQPFGGWKNSCYGPGAKAGGPNYVAQFLTWESDGSLPKSTKAPGAYATDVLDALVSFAGKENTALIKAAASNYAEALAAEFDVAHDPTGIAVESNVFRYRRDKKALVRYGKADTKADIALALMAAGSVRIATVVSAEPGLDVPHIAGVEVIHETEQQLAERLAKGGETGVFRALSPVSDAVLRAVNTIHLRPVLGKPVVNGRLELRGYYREQAVSTCLHRYGTLITPPQHT